MGPIKMFHNPSYPESRAASAILDENNTIPTIVYYLENPLSQKKLFNPVEKLDVPIQSIIRIDEPEYKKLNLDNNLLNKSTLKEIICECPKLIQRQIVVQGEIAVIARSICNLLKIIK